MMSSLNNILEVIVLKIENIPCSERPRERLKNVGVENLSNNELLSIILKTGTKDKNVMELSYEILKMVGDIKDFKDLTLLRIIEVKGVFMSCDTFVINSVRKRSLFILSCTAIWMPACSRFSGSAGRRKGPNNFEVSNLVDRASSARLRLASVSLVNCSTQNRRNNASATL